MIIQQLLKKTNLSSPEDLNQPEKLFTFLNPVSYLIARKLPETYSSFQYLLADGWLFVAALKVIGVSVERYSFDMTSLAPIAFHKASVDNKTIYFIGSKPKEIERFILVIKKNFPTLNIVGFRSGYFDTPEERKMLINHLSSQSPDIVVAGLGVPLQEKFLLDLQNTGWTGCGYTCGGFIHQTSGKLNYYPNWVNKYHLRMPYRFVNEPHFRKRVPDYVKFLFVFFYDYIKYVKERRSSK